MTDYSSISPVSVSSPQSIQAPVVNTISQNYDTNMSTEAQTVPIDNKADRPMPINEIPSEVIKAYYLSQLENQSSKYPNNPILAYRD